MSWRRDVCLCRSWSLSYHHKTTLRCELPARLMIDAHDSHRVAHAYTPESISRPLPDQLVELIARLRLVGQPLRIRMLDHLERNGEREAQQLADELDALQQNISKHLAALLNTGLVKRRQQGRTVRYGLADDDVLPLLERVGQRIVEDLSSTRSIGRSARGSSATSAPAPCASARSSRPAWTTCALATRWWSGASIAWAGASAISST